MAAFDETPHGVGPASFAGKKRYLSGKAQETGALLAAAREHVAMLGDGKGWLHRKPFDSSPHDRDFSDDVYPVLGMPRPPGSWTW